MLITVEAVRDEDGKVLATSSFDIADRDAREQALADLLERVVKLTPDLLNLQSFSFKFDPSSSPH